MGRNRVTIRDIASELQLSVAAVSNALNGNLGEVSAATVARVEATAERMGYTSNRAARALRTGKQNAISLHIPNFVRSLSFYMDFTLGVAEAAAAADFDLLLVTSGAAAGTRLQVDGAVVVDWLPGEVAPRRMVAAGIPVVAAGDVPDPEITPDLVVRIPYATMTEQMVDAAVAAGGSRLVMIAPDSEFESDWSTSIVAGVESACARHGITPIIERLSVTSDARAVTAAAKEAIELHDPDIMVFGPQRFAGIAVPELSIGTPNSSVPFVISCAGDPVTELPSGRITAIDTSPRAFGARCANELVALVQKGARQKDNKPRQTVLGEVFISRIEQPAQILWSDHWCSNML